jgi:hypothetical protein
MGNKSGRIAPGIEWSTHGFEFEESRETLHGQHALDCEGRRSQLFKYRSGDVTANRIAVIHYFIVRWRLL